MAAASSAFRHRVACLLLAGWWAPLFAEQLQIAQPTQEFHPAFTDQDVVARFAFTNAGPGPLTITATRTSCGCTTTTLDKTTFQSGEKGELVATFTIGGRSGAQDKTIEVSTDCAAQPLVLLHLKVFLPEPPTLAPAFVSWPRGGERAPRRVIISAAAGSPYRVLKAVPSSPQLAATLTPGEAAGTWLLTLTPTSTDQALNATVEIVTNGPKRLYVFANVTEAQAER